MTFNFRQIWLSVHLLIVACFATDDSTTSPPASGSPSVKSYLAESNDAFLGGDGSSYYYTTFGNYSYDAEVADREVLFTGGLWYNISSPHGRFFVKTTRDGVTDVLEAKVLGQNGEWRFVDTKRGYLTRGYRSAETIVTTGGPHVLYREDNGLWPAVRMPGDLLPQAHLYEWLTGADGFVYVFEAFKNPDSTNAFYDVNFEVLGSHGLWHGATTVEGERIIKASPEDVRQGFEAEVLGNDGEWHKYPLTQGFIVRAGQRADVPKDVPYVVYHTKNNEWRQAIVSDDHHLLSHQLAKLRGAGPYVNPTFKLYATDGYWYTFSLFRFESRTRLTTDAEVFGTDGKWYGISTTAGANMRTVSLLKTSPDVEVLQLDGKKIKYTTKTGVLFRQPGAAENVNSKQYHKVDGQWVDGAATTTAAPTSSTSAAAASPTSDAPASPTTAAPTSSTSVAAASPTTAAPTSSTSAAAASSTSAAAASPASVAVAPTSSTSVAAASSTDAAPASPTSAPVPEGIST